MFASKSRLLSDRISYQLLLLRNKGSTASCVHKSTIIRANNTIRYFTKSSITNEKLTQKQERAKKLLEEQLKSPYRLIRWAAIARTEQFQKGLTKYLVGIYIVFFLYGGYIMRKLFNREKELEALLKKDDKDKNQWEKLREKELDKDQKLRTRDELKLKQYQLLKEEYGIQNFDGIVIEDYEDTKHLVERITGQTLKEDDAVLEQFKKEQQVPNILPPRDTTDFYDSKARKYDSDIGMEEKIVFMGSKRKWLTSHCKGDVLEVSCGTGRNIKYLDPTKLNSVTFLDASRNMVEVTQEKFRNEYPGFAKAAFVVGKAEDLIDLDKKNQVKYDTILEAFGLCSHKDPVRALKNFEQLLKPDGRIILLEHGRGDYDFVNKVLDKRADNRLETWGCRWNLDIGELLDDSGLEVVEEKRFHLGTTWAIVAKRKGAAKKKEEIGFIEKYIGSSVRKRANEFIDHDDKIANQQKTDLPENKK
ncbi:related to Methyltransferase OMS1, mitochondrial [Saccharomycodes ludwigii]|uniref:Related to Methyltransferase OMS1, mitochondrial n=1 Tax=Saccharomycodes ludwigii TaxID=36035 RepID=A0A376BBS2_9ASCO|nr:hypothetical protein SCDLUD_004655 [Saccharomycodes ludwigii]KAH3899223.1 hypothetical protein SCDLUD_004655 [Saccharomycodes ludwigii]SSD61994.1 related to Methyltransferase OMS1, mitochondrial [Saccharomycodes ludwigii]